MIINYNIKPAELQEKLDLFWQLSGEKILKIESEYNPAMGAPVFTVNGKYSTRGWTEWTQGFQYGSAILQYDATSDATFLKIGRENTVDKMAPHVSHIGVHDHGFNNLSTYGNLHRLMQEGKITQNKWEKNFYELALKASGAVQASRWSKTADGGYIYSFNGPHSLFVDTIRSCRVLMVAHQLGHYLPGENDVHISLFGRAINHLLATAKYSVFYNEGRDSYDEWGRTAHESVFNPNDGNFRCPNSQQGYTGFSTWIRGLAWAMLGFAEELEFLETIPEKEFEEIGSKEDIMQQLLKGAKATCDFYISNTPVDGIPYWDAGAPGLSKMGDYLNVPANPYNAFEPVDSSAAAIGVQGLLRLGHFLKSKGETEDGNRYWQAGLTVIARLLETPYLSVDSEHQGVLLHSVYHHPNGWDNIPEGQKVPCNESSMWGDYHMRESALYLSKIISEENYYTFYNGII
ncbi:MAG: glycoside hydrolase family 88 protein [Salinivirgaceae bacterium]|jgi:unsaturated chondroitin disaccharide hydrolase|nr:glycoside hydrolase family 88 protein [Salinivirgaceae bacterium]